MRLVMHGGVVEYEDEGTGPVLTLVHGDPGRPGDFRWMIPFLSSRFRVLRIALPGLDLTDLSVNSSPEISARATFIRQVLDRLQIDQTILLGHSMGSALVLEHGVHWPDKTRGVVLLNPVGPSPHKAFKSLRDNPLLPLLETPLRPLLLMVMHKAFTRAGFPKGVSKSALLHVIRCVRAFDFDRHIQNLQSLSVPCLRIHSKDDPLISMKHFVELERLIKPGMSHIFEQAGHNPQKTNPESLSLIINEWAQEHGLFDD